MAEPVGARRFASSPGVLVEFAGLPGSGKSTIAHALAELLRERGVMVSEPTWSADHALRPSSRMLRKCALALLASARDPRRARDIVDWVARSRQPTTREVVKLALNALYLLEAADRRARRAGVHILDQGVLQQIWSVLYRSSAGDDIEWRATEQLALTTALMNVVIVDAPLGVLQSRLEARSGGASRLERHIRHSGPRAILERAAFAQQRVEALAESLNTRGIIRLLHVSGAGERSPKMVASRVLDWLSAD